MAGEFVKNRRKAFLFDSFMELSLYYDPSLKEKIAKDFIDKATEAKSESEFLEYLEKAVQVEDTMRKPVSEALIKKATEVKSESNFLKYLEKAVQVEDTMRKPVSEVLIKKANTLLESSQFKSASKYYSKAMEYHSVDQDEIREQLTHKLPGLNTHISGRQLVGYLQLAKKYLNLSILAGKILSKAESLLKLDNSTAAQTYLQSGIAVGIFQNQQALSGRLNRAIVELCNQILSRGEEKFIQTTKFFKAKIPDIFTVTDSRGLYIRTAFYYYSRNFREAVKVAKLLSNKYPQSKEASIVKTIIEPLPPLPVGKRTVNLSISLPGSKIFTINWVEIKESPPTPYRTAIFNVSIENIKSNESAYFTYAGDWNTPTPKPVKKELFKRNKRKCEAVNFYVYDDAGNKYPAKMPLFTDIAKTRTYLDGAHDSMKLRPREKLTHDIVFPNVKTSALGLTFVFPELFPGGAWKQKEIRFKDIGLRKVKFERIR